MVILYCHMPFFPWKLYVVPCFCELIKPFELRGLPLHECFYMHCREEWARHRARVEEITTLTARQRQLLYEALPPIQEWLAKLDLNKAQELLLMHQIFMGHSEISTPVLSYNIYDLFAAACHTLPLHVSILSICIRHDKFQTGQCALYLSKETELRWSYFSFHGKFHGPWFTFIRTRFKFHLKLNHEIYC